MKKDDQTKNTKRNGEEDAKSTGDGAKPRFVTSTLVKKITIEELKKQLRKLKLSTMRNKADLQLKNYEQAREESNVDSDTEVIQNIKNSDDEKENEEESEEEPIRICKRPNDLARSVQDRIHVVPDNVMDERMLLGKGLIRQMDIRMKGGMLSIKKLEYDITKKDAEERKKEDNKDNKEEKRKENNKDDDKERDGYVAARDSKDRQCGAKRGREWQSGGLFIGVAEIRSEWRVLGRAANRETASVTMAAMLSLTGHNGGDGDGVLNAGSWAGPSGSHGGGTLRLLLDMSLRCFRWRGFSAGPGLSDGALRPVMILDPLLLTTSAMSLLVGYDVADVHCCSVRNQVRFEIARTTVVDQSRLPLDHVEVTNVGISLSGLTTTSVQGSIVHGTPAQPPATPLDLSPLRHHRSPATTPVSYSPSNSPALDMIQEEHPVEISRSRTSGGHPADTLMSDSMLSYGYFRRSPEDIQELQKYHEQYPNHWIGRRGSVLWPPRPLDLNPLDYYLWEYVKNAVKAPTMKLNMMKKVRRASETRAKSGHVNVKWSIDTDESGNWRVNEGGKCDTSRNSGHKDDSERAQLFGKAAQSH
ncbi:hypothetical protein G5I_09380 [Acromyrmex echinatior]|uniref:SAP domain-containing protein n=1 Tax=Acromyrmex echinatior TaxID=103372 RepID=F4WU26_ACREC|nr:hypothetical protein G5I_09380 [Acromyrmex echinatior]